MIPPWQIRGRTLSLRRPATPAEMDQIRALFSDYAASLGIDLGFQGFETELRTLPGKYAPPEGSLLLALAEGGAAGCVAFRRLSAEICEMKRLYVRPGFRGLGIGKALLSQLLEEARAAGYRRIRLDTLPSMDQAQALYAAFGFYAIEPYAYNPVPEAKFLELELSKAVFP